MSDAPSCATCRWVKRGVYSDELCAHDEARLLSWGDSLYADIMRDGVHPCGPTGKLYEPAANPAKE